MFCGGVERICSATLLNPIPRTDVRCTLYSKYVVDPKSPWLWRQHPAEPTTFVCPPRTFADRGCKAVWTAMNVDAPPPERRSATGFALAAFASRFVFVVTFVSDSTRHAHTQNRRHVGATFAAHTSQVTSRSGFIAFISGFSSSKAGCKPALRICSSLASPRLLRSGCLAH